VSPARDARRASELCAALSRRAGRDDAFRDHLAHWQERALLLHATHGNTTNSLTGGTQNGPVVQGRDFSGLTFRTGPGRAPH
jgi:hypothetical protein